MDHYVESILSEVCCIIVLLGLHTSSRVTEMSKSNVGVVAAVAAAGFAKTEDYADLVPPRNVSEDWKRDWRMCSWIS